MLARGSILLTAGTAGCSWGYFCAQVYGLHTDAHRELLEEADIHACALLAVNCYYSGHRMYKSIILVCTPAGTAKVEPGVAAHACMRACLAACAELSHALLQAWLAPPLLCET